MIGREMGFRPELNDAELISLLGGIGKTGNSGTELKGLADIAKSMNLRTEVRDGADLGWLRQRLNQGKRVIVNGNPMSWSRSDTRPYGHYVLARKGKGTNFEVADPYYPERTSATPEMLRRFLEQHREGGHLIAVW